MRGRNRSGLGFGVSSQVPTTQIFLFGRKRNTVNEMKEHNDGGPLRIKERTEMRKAEFVSVLAMVVTVIFVQPVTAGLISQSAHYDFSIEPGASSFQEYMGGFFAQFDDQGGTLTLERVTLLYGITASAHVTIENDNEYQMTGPGSMTASSHLGVSPGPSPIDMYSDEIVNVLAPSDGVSGSGPDFYDFGIISCGDAPGGSWETTSDLEWFSSGNPEDEFVFNGSAEFTLGGEMGGLLTVSDFTASMNARLTYEYVPEPATLSLLALGGLALIKRRRG